MARRVDVVRDYLLKEHNLDLSEENIIKQFCPTAWRYEINKLKCHDDLINKYEIFALIDKLL